MNKFFELFIVFFSFISAFFLIGALLANYFVVRRERKRLDERARLSRPRTPSKEEIHTTTHSKPLRGRDNSNDWPGYGPFVMGHGELSAASSDSSSECSYSSEGGME